MQGCIDFRGVRNCIKIESIHLKHFDTKDHYYVFGHAHASAMNYYELGIESNDVFVMGNFIGIDANTIHTKEVHILVFDETGKRLK